MPLFYAILHLLYFMPTLSERIEAFAQLGKYISELNESSLESLCQRAQAANNWFSPVHVRYSLQSIGGMLQQEALTQWVEAYPLKQVKTRNVGVVMAGNIPMVGFHDMLCVLLSGHRILAKPSSNDTVLMQWLASVLTDILPSLKDAIHFTERLSQYDAVIATGSNNTARYFEAYFAKHPHIIRKNRSSCAILDGRESTEQLQAIGTDMLWYYGMGCRSVSKLLVPDGYNFTPFFEAIQSLEYLSDHHKYRHNYDYNKSIYLVNGEPHLDNGFLLLKEDVALASPVSVAFYQYYSDADQAKQYCAQHADALQCIVSGLHWIEGAVAPGQAQKPGLSDYADGVDTLAFLAEL
jgi:hypothetical protein